MQSEKIVKSQISNSQGEIFFELDNVLAPENWSSTAIDIAASKYFRKTGIKRPPKEVEAFISRLKKKFISSENENKTSVKSGADENYRAKNRSTMKSEKVNNSSAKARASLNSETSITQLIGRVVYAIVNAGVKQGLLQKKSMQIFAEDLFELLINQKAAFNSPVWFNTGLFEAYGIKSESEHYYWNSKLKKIQSVKNAYEHPQCSACFIQSVDDSLDSIFELLKSEARLFKYGSGSGTNFSTLRSKYEHLESGGYSSGLISFLEIFDKSAGAVKSGGTTRRAAKMVILDCDHPEIEDFVNWKMSEEKKAQGLISIGYDNHYEGSAYRTVSGQNSNNSVRMTDKFINAVLENKTWDLKTQSGKTLKSIQAKELWDKIIKSAWTCADPGVQFHDTINKWHTCASSSEIRASNPCSEFMFLDNTACNLASLNLVKFVNPDLSFDFEKFQRAVSVLIIAQEILVDYSSYPTAQIAQNSHDYRPLGIGFANLGGMLMQMGIPYDSELARQWASLLSSMLTARAYLTSSEIAKKLKAFAKYKQNKKSMLRVIKQHRTAFSKISFASSSREVKYKESHAGNQNRKTECPLNYSRIQDQEFRLAAKQTLAIWDECLKHGTKFGFRNSQVSCIAPTGTIGLFMDCDTLGIEPEYSLIKNKKLAGGGNFQIINQSVEKALKNLNYSEEQIQKIRSYIFKNNTVEGCQEVLPEHLSVFDCAHEGGGKRKLSIDAHIKMMAAVQPFISGAISKTVNMPSKSTEHDVSEVYLNAWKLGLKSVAIYRDNSKASQPLEQRRIQCPDCGCDAQLVGGCFSCPQCGTTVGCA